MAVVRKKTWPSTYELFATGKRTLELRLADFDLKTGDTLIFEEYDPKTKKYTGRSTKFKCQKVERSVKNPLQFYPLEEIRKYGFWIIDLKKIS